MRRGDTDENTNSQHKSAPITSQISLDETELANNVANFARLHIILVSNILSYSVT